MTHRGTSRDRRTIREWLALWLVARRYGLTPGDAIDVQHYQTRWARTGLPDSAVYWTRLPRRRRAGYRPVVPPDAAP